MAEVVGRRRKSSLVLACVIIVATEVATWILMRSQGIVITGDAPNYLIAAKALASLHVTVLQAFRNDFRTHTVYRWSKGVTVLTSGAHFYPGPHGKVFSQGIGLPIILAVFIAVGNVPTALIGYFAILGVAMVYLFDRSSRLVDLKTSAKVLFALCLLGPALWLESTQVFPDFLAGILLSCALINVAWLERKGELERRHLIVTALCLAIPPWLQIKNFSVVALVALALFALMVRRVVSFRTAGILLGVAVGSFLLLLCYNHYYFNHFLGLPPSPSTFSSIGIHDVLALLFDKDQGLFVQVPTALVGVLGICYAAKRLPFASLAAIFGVFGLLVINGVQNSLNALGGVALAGRFEITTLPIILAWCPWFLRRLQARKLRLLILGVVIGFLWVAQAIPIIIGDHSYFNASFKPFAPFDPSLYPGWWPWFNKYLPILPFHYGLSWSKITSYLIAEILLLLGLALCLIWMGSGASSRSRSVVHWHIRELRVLLAPLLVALSLLAALGVANLGESDQLPDSHLIVSAKNLGSPFHAGKTSFVSTFAPVGDVGPGHFQVAIDESANTFTSDGFTVLAVPLQKTRVIDWWTPTHPTNASKEKTLAQPISKSIVNPHHYKILYSHDRQRIVNFRTKHPCAIYISFQVSSNSVLAISSLFIKKISS